MDPGAAAILDTYRRRLTTMEAAVIRLSEENQRLREELEAKRELEVLATKETGGRSGQWPVASGQ